VLGEPLPAVPTAGHPLATSHPKQPSPSRSYTFRATLSQFLVHCVAKLYVPIRSVRPSRNSWILCCPVIRSYTFCATLSQFLYIMLQSYTFLYVP